MLGARVGRVLPIIHPVLSSFYLKAVQWSLLKAVQWSLLFGSRSPLTATSYTHILTRFLQYLYNRTCVFQLLLCKRTRNPRLVLFSDTEAPQGREFIRIDHLLENTHAPEQDKRQPTKARCTATTTEREQRN